MPIKKDDFVLDFLDRDNKRYAFEKKNFDKHKGKHPELLELNFFDRMKSAIIDPEFIYPAYGFHNRFCYYYYEFQIENIKWYTKVVVQKVKFMYIIITGFRADHIREVKYFKSPCKRP